MHEEEIIQRIQGLYPQALIDINGSDCSFEVYVVTEEFAGINTLQRQQPILALVQVEIRSGRLHALSIKAKTPQELSAGSSGLVQIL